MTTRLLRRCTPRHDISMIHFCLTLLFWFVLMACVPHFEPALPGWSEAPDRSTQVALERFVAYRSQLQPLQGAGKLSLRYQDFTVDLDHASRVEPGGNYLILLVDDFGNSVAQAVSRLGLESAQTLLTTGDHNQWACRVKLPLSAAEMASVLAGDIPATGSLQGLARKQDLSLVSDGTYFIVLNAHGQPQSLWRRLASGKLAYQIDLADFARNGRMIHPHAIKIRYAHGELTFTWKDAATHRGI